MIQLGSDEFCLHSWNKDMGDGETVVLIYHGLGAHGLYPTVRYAAELLASSSLSSGGKPFKVLAPDMRGHGKSSGLSGYLPSADVVVEDAYNVALYAMKEFQPKRIFFVGSSMGGTIALKVAQKLNEKKKQDGAAATNTTTIATVAGVILLAPMLKLNVSSLEQSLLSGLAMVFSSWRLIPSSSTNASKQYRDEKKRRECENDPWSNKASTICVGTAHTCVSLASGFDFGQIQVPFWLGVADEDVVVNNQGSLNLYEQSPSTDKTMKRYAALHGLLCEPPPLYDQITQDIMDWVRERC